jgi:hypothetical protein
MADRLNGTQPPLGPTANLPLDGGDIARLWIDTGLGDPLTEQHLHVIPVGKPRDFFRTHPSPTYRATTEMYTHKPEGAIDVQHYLVAPEMRGCILEARPCILICVVDRAGGARLWPIPSPRDGEHDNDAWVSARAAAREGLDRWTRLVWHKRAYKTRPALPGYAPDPDFSKLPPFEEMVRIAFGEHGIIRDGDHPIYRELFGAPTRGGIEDEDIGPKLG